MQAPSFGDESDTKTVKANFPVSNSNPRDLILSSAICWENMMASPDCDYMVEEAKTSFTAPAQDALLLVRDSNILRPHS